MTHVTNENFEQLLASDKPLVIDFWATWCGPCRKIAPDVEALAELYAEQVNIVKCDVEEADEVAEQYGIRNIPTLLFIKNGEVKDKLVGANSRATMEEKVKALI